MKIRLNRQGWMRIPNRCANLLPSQDWRRFRLTEDLESFATWLRQSPQLHEVRAGPAAMEELCALDVPRGVQVMRDDHELCEVMM